MTLAVNNLRAACKLADSWKRHEWSKMRMQRCPKYIYTYIIVEVRLQDKK